MNRVAVLGANSLIGQHLLTLLPSVTGLEAINVWTLSEKFTRQVQANNNDAREEVPTSEFQGLPSLADAVAGCDTVFNLHEFQDFSAAPDSDALQEHNVEFTRRLLDVCTAASVSRIVHLSSTLVQCSWWWPNTFNREAGPKQGLERALSAYCLSKIAAEDLLFEADGMQLLCARVGAIYGEGDRSSIVCDLLRESERFGALPVVGDGKEAFQYTFWMTYAGNVAAALTKCAEKLAADRSLQKELVLITDATPITNIYDAVVQPICSNPEESGCSDKSFANEKPIYHMPFILFAFFYAIAFVYSWITDTFSRTDISRQVLPSATYLHLVFYHYSFMNSLKLRLLFDFTPKFSYEESVRRSRTYYAGLDLSTTSPSWKSYPR